MIPEDLSVWLEAVDPDRAHLSRAGLLCRRHADAMVVPRGWSLDDRREPMPRLFQVPRRPVRTERAGDNTARLRRPRHEDWASLALFDVDENTEADTPPELEPSAVSAAPVEVAAAEVVSEASATTASPEAEQAVTDDADPGPWAPRFDRTDDLGGLLTARSPLLRRAFGIDDPDPDDGPQR